MEKKTERERVRAKLEAHIKEEDEIKERLKAVELLVSAAKTEYADLKMRLKVIEGKKQVREEDLKELE